MKNNSDTMELDSILEEIRSGKNSSSSPRGNSQSRGQSAPAARNISRRNVVYTDSNMDVEDNYVFTDDDYTEIAPVKRKAPASKKPAVKYQPEPYVKPKKKGKGGLIAVLCILGVLLIAAGAGALMYLKSGSEPGPTGTFSDNVYVSGVSLKDMTMDEAKRALAPVEQKLADGIKITVKAGDKSYDFGKDSFKHTFDTDAILSEAKQYSEERGFKTEDKEYEIKMTVDDSNCETIIRNIAKELDTDPKDARVSEFDPDAEDMFTFSSEQKGVSVNQEESIKALSSFIKSGNIAGTVEATVTEVDPVYTEAYLRDNITKLSSFSTYSTNNSNGNENMRVSLAACNGSIIDPDETWSFNACTGDSNLTENGYLPAGVIVQGRSETGVGGGICQSSTTIYNAGILCGMDVEERACHYYKSTYVDAGRDATIDYGNIDLKLSNPFDYQLFMRCWMDGAELNCEIYGLENPKFDDVEISTTDPSYFGNGYTVYTTRYYYKDGEEVDYDELPSSTYYTSAP